MNIIKLNIKNCIFLLFFFIIILKFLNVFYNTYYISVSNYEKRMTSAYGYCKNESWGFFNEVYKKYNLKDKKINIINDEGHVLLDTLFNIKKTYNDAQYLIVLNLQTTNKNNIYNLKFNNIKKYSVKYRFNNCYLMELND